jgi:ubiquinone/menaquinone biosynthesis C-methylase UbiE
MVYDPSSVIAHSGKYINNLRRVLKDCGRIICSDLNWHSYNEYDEYEYYEPELTNFMKMYDKLSDTIIKRYGVIENKKNRDAIQFLLDRLVEIEKGVYEFK